MGKKFMSSADELVIPGFLEAISPEWAAEVGRLRYLSHGMATTVMVGRGPYVVRSTDSTRDCKSLASVTGAQEKRGVAIGWPTIFLYADKDTVGFEWRQEWDRLSRGAGAPLMKPPTCVAVVEKVKIGDAIGRLQWSELVEATSLAEDIAPDVRRACRGRSWPEACQAVLWGTPILFSGGYGKDRWVEGGHTRRTLRYAEDLAVGLLDRDSRLCNLDVHHGNIGIAKGDRAVWVDFGI